MKSKHKKGLEREAPYSHVIQALIPLIFTAVWIIDSIWLQLSTFLNQYIPLYIRISLFVLFVILAVIFGIPSHKLLFHEHEPSSELITDSILGYVRNPLYLAILLFYIAFICLSISLLSAGIFIIALIIYNWMVNREEQILEDLFGDDYRKYKQNVPKWIPQIKKYESN
jgi:protein-S-isoprenylcysteine O-methyltransferase Ste14